MAGLSRLDVSEFTDLNDVASWYIRLRWLAVFGVLSALALSSFAWHHTLPLGALLYITLALALLNALFHLYFFGAKGSKLSQTELGIFFEIQILCDYVLLYLLVYFTGFFENPFIYFFIFHILLTAYLFAARVVLGYVVVLVALSGMGAFLEYLRVLPHYPLFDLPEASYRDELIPRLLGFVSTISISGYLGASINRRLKDTAMSVEIELNRYKSLDKIKSNFILQVTHELRGPLAAVKGFHEMIERGIAGPIEPKAAELLGRATRRTDGLLQMIDEMLDYAYMETEDRQRFARVPLKMEEIIAANVEALVASAEAKGIAIESHCQAGLTIEANRDLLNIILSNLISNAIRYSPSGSRIRVTVQREAAELRIEVGDEGIGMSPEELEHIFEEFYRARKAREMERDGTGLGLSIIKKAVETLGGRIVVASEPGKGSTFHIYLPKEG
ncbi:MAG: HAMP domain-containing sensor histidine kinase [Spirochaetota bacterium]